MWSYVDLSKIFRWNTDDDNDEQHSSESCSLHSPTLLISVRSLNIFDTDLFRRLASGEAWRTNSYNSNSAILESNEVGRKDCSLSDQLQASRSPVCIDDIEEESHEEKLSENEQKIRAAAGRTLDELSLNHRVPDDLINNYCERLQETVNREMGHGAIEGMLAMQFITLEPESIYNHITGRQRVFQVILDHERAHYVLLEYQARERCIRIYDPLIPSEFDYETLLNLFPDNIKQQIIAIFGHLFTSDEVTVLIVQGIQKQKDGWSCGLRAIGHLTLRVCDKRVEDFDLELSKVLDFFSTILDKRNPTFNEFYNANLGRKRPKAKEQSFFRFLLNKNSKKITVTV